MISKFKNRENFKSFETYLTTLALLIKQLTLTIVLKNSFFIKYGFKSSITKDYYNFLRLNKNWL